MYLSSRRWCQKLIETHTGNSTVASAHTMCIDLNIARDINAGVVVTLRKEVWRPVSSDYVSDKLTCQLQGGAKVYSLMTKGIYRDKAMDMDYNSSFDQLTINFRWNKLKTLFCLQIGSVRDTIRPERFVLNLVKFQQATELK